MIITQNRSKIYFNIILFSIILLFFLIPLLSQAAYDNGTCAAAQNNAECVAGGCSGSTNSIGECYLANNIQWYCCAPAQVTPPDSNYKYTPLEPIFEGEDSGDFVEYIQSIYRFLIWTVGIAALLMLMIGGFMYMTSAGNQASAETAKRIIKDALLGLVVVLFAWVLLYWINPDFTKINLDSITGLKYTLNKPSGGGGTGNLNTNFSPPIPLQDPRAPGPIPAGSLDEEAARTLAESLNIDINRTQGCSPTVQEACTSLAGLPSAVLFDLSEFESEIGGNVTLTGGTESSLHSNGTLHGPGNPVYDIGKNDSAVNAFFNDSNNVKYIGDTSVGKKYRVTKGSLSGSEVIYESNHYHVNSCTAQGVSCQPYYR